MIIKLKNSNFTNTSLPNYVPKLSGFSLDGLKNLYLFDGGNPSTSIIDKTGLFNTAVVLGVQGTSTKTNLSGGAGINITKSASIPASPLDATLPFTIMFAGSIELPFGTNSAIIGFKEFFEYGFQIYLRNSTSTTSSKLETSIRQSLNGAQDAVTTAYNDTNTATFKDLITFYAHYDGSGKMNFFIYDGDILIDASNSNLSVNESGYTTNASAVVKTMLTPVIGTGTPNGSFHTGNLNVDVFGTYTKALTTSEMSLNAKKAKEIMISRGRLSQ